MKVKIQQSKKRGSWLKVFLHFTLAGICFYAAYAFGSSNPKDIGEAASKLTSTFSNVGSLVVGAAYLAGFGFVVAGIFKFKQAKDSHGQIPMSTPIAVVGVGAALIFLPSLITIVSQSIFSTPTYGGFSGSGANEVGKSS